MLFSRHPDYFGKQTGLDSLLHSISAYICRYMKLMHYILALYTILLSCIPCQDEAIVVDEMQLTSISADAHAGGSELVDLCSPFCICACCAGVTLQQVPAALPEAASSLFFQDQFDAYAAPGHSENLHVIWQPPRA
jgi:hypothetical protein